MASPFMTHPVVPVANEEDARATAAALEPYEVGRLTVCHVVEKGGGAPDKLSVEQAERKAADAFSAFRETFPDAEVELTYRRDIVAAIVDLSADREASAIVFRPRGGNRLVQFLAGDRALRLITEADRPVVALREVDTR